MRRLILQNNAYLHWLLVQQAHRKRNEVISEIGYATQSYNPPILCHLGYGYMNNERKTNIFVFVIAYHPRQCLSNILLTTSKHFVRVQFTVYVGSSFFGYVSN